MNSTSVREWLPLPSGISIHSHYSFTNDLLGQFDIKYNQLLDNQNMIPANQNSVNQTSSINSAIIQSNVSVGTSIHSFINHARAMQDSSISLPAKDNAHSVNRVNIEANRRRSAGNLLRKSSSFLRRKQKSNQQQTIGRASLFHSWTLKKKKSCNSDAQDIIRNEVNAFLPPNKQSRLSKVAMNTVVHISNQRQHDQHGDGTSILQRATLNIPQLIQPPIITQYPPKPLVYSPVEPLSDEEDGNFNAGSETGKKFYSLSLPLKFHQHSQRMNETMTTSDSGLLLQIPQDQIAIAEKSKQNSVFRSLSKKWNKLVHNCKVIKK